MLLIIPFGFICMWFDFPLIGQFLREHGKLNLDNLFNKMKVICSFRGSQYYKWVEVNRMYKYTAFKILIE